MRHIALVAMLALASVPTARADSRYVIRGGEVYDSQTKLTWARCSVGQTWNNQHCVGTVGYFDFATAQKQASGGWRVPTKDELVSLIDPNRKKFPVLDTAAFPDMDATHPWYWSSTPNGSSIAWYVDFTDGYTSGFVDEANPLAIRLVRSQP
ncbi:MAG: DUF1566 domain-containing protein [Gallionella sp.]